MTSNEKLKERLELLSEPKQNGCIEWTGYTENGYGRLMIGSRKNIRKTVRAHRLAYELHFGKIPDGMCICHKCDNRKCINPNHLFVGTKKDNSVDMVSKNRHSMPSRKLTDEQINYVRSQKGIKTSKHLGVELGISYHSIKKLWCGQTYSSIPEPPKEK